MEKIRVSGGNRLSGSAVVGGAKNAALPLIAAALLTDEPILLKNMPDLHDTRLMGEILRHMGAAKRHDKADGSMALQARGSIDPSAPEDIAASMRASVLVLGPLLARFGSARVPLPGGCAIGARPVDFHIQALRAMGADIRLERGALVARAPDGGLRAVRHRFPSPSVGATENLLIAAALADGDSLFENCAMEPEIVDLAALLRAMGAEVDGAGTPTVRVRGSRSLRGAVHEVMPDRIEAGTLLCAAAAAGGSVRLDNAPADSMGPIFDALERMGFERPRADGRSLHFDAGSRPRPIEISTEPHPGFPTDMQAQFMALASRASGTSLVVETIFENRFMHAAELARMGACIRVDGRRAEVFGVDALQGAGVRATDLRSGACLVVAALAAEGESLVGDLRHLDRGYEKLEEKLFALGADIERIPSADVPA